MHARFLGWACREAYRTYQGTGQRFQRAGMHQARLLDCAASPNLCCAGIARRTSSSACVPTIQWVLAVRNFPNTSCCVSAFQRRIEAARCHADRSALSVCCQSSGGLPGPSLATCMHRCNFYQPNSHGARLNPHRTSDHAHGASVTPTRIHGSASMVLHVSSR